MRGISVLSSNSGTRKAVRFTFRLGKEKPDKDLMVKIDMSIRAYDFRDRFYCTNIIFPLGQIYFDYARNRLNGYRVFMVPPPRNPSKLNSKYNQYQTPIEEWFYSSKIRGSEKLKGQKKILYTGGLLLVLGIIALLTVNTAISQIEVRQKNQDIKINVPTQLPPSPAPTINPAEFKINTSHGNITLAQLAEIQPGLGTVMMEYANRFWSMYYAAKSNNWDLAGYQLKEAIEIQEVGETTRPARAPMLKAFESSFLGTLNNTINAKDFNAFQTAYNNTIDGCNSCHIATGFPYIKYTLPSSPPNIP
ncbi:MAG: hypothetical protein OIN66_10645 [Candidatus Methanoperedens sp.]|nr:hypothetical protein [Candidatus Methanoperedens sp.]